MRAFVLSCSLVLLGSVSASAVPLAPSVYATLPLGSIAPKGWLLEQLVLQANSLSGSLASSTFPGADIVNGSIWMGGTITPEGGTTQWLPYWTNGNVPLAGLLEAAGPATTARLSPDFNLIETIDQWMEYVLSTTNKTNGWIGPYANEPGDVNGHGLWDPLNMIRSLMMYAESHPAREKRVAQAVIAHLTSEAELVKTDPIYKWAQTRWPTFVEICLYVVDHYVPKYGSDPDIVPLGTDATNQMLLDASELFREKGMDWPGYYHRTDDIKFPFGSVAGWNTNDHGVNNAEGAMRWPAASYRLDGGSETDRAEMDYMLHMLDEYQGQPNALFCADEVFCGRAPNRGTETCAVVEAMTSLSYAFVTLGDPALMDRVERLAFNAMPAALTSDMWTHVYVQQANSVFAGKSVPSERDPSLRHHSLHHQHSAPTSSESCASCRTLTSNDQDEPGGSVWRADPSTEDQTSNFFGVSHFPCCITNFPQGWPKFAMHAFVASPTDNSFVVASLVPAQASLPSSVGGGATVETDSMYPFGDNATVTVKAPQSTTAQIRIPGWATRATVNGQPAVNGTLFAVPCPGGKTTQIVVELNPEIRVEFGWGEHGVQALSPVDYHIDGAKVPTSDVTELDLRGGAHLVGSREADQQDIGSGGPGQITEAAILHPLYGEGHYISRVTFSYRYVSGYTPQPGTTVMAANISLVLVDAETDAELATIYQSPPLDEYSSDDYTGYSAPILVDVDNLKVANSRSVLLKIVFFNNGRNLQLQLDPALTVHWSSDVGPDPSPPHSEYLTPPTNGVSVTRGPLLFALHPAEEVIITKTYEDDLPVRPHAVDYEISTSEDWNFGLVLDSPPGFVNKPSAGWDASLPFSTTEYPFSIKVTGRQVPEWGFWNTTKITNPPPASPLDPSNGEGVELKLVPFGGSNIRISVFPWFAQ